MEVLSLCTKHCDNCIYRKKFSFNTPYCDYLCMTGKRRPCPGGDECTAKVTRRVYRKKKRTHEELDARAEKERERNRRKSHAYYERHKDEINARAKEKRKSKCGC